MALINCPECGKEISDKAKSCPNCGHPMKPHNSITSKANTEPILLIYVLGAFLTSISFFLPYSKAITNLPFSGESSFTYKIFDLVTFARFGFGGIIPWLLLAISIGSTILGILLIFNKRIIPDKVLYLLPIIEVVLYVTLEVLLRINNIDKKAADYLNEIGKDVGAYANVGKDIGFYTLLLGIILLIISCFVFIKKHGGINDIKAARASIGQKITPLAKRRIIILGGIALALVILLIGGKSILDRPNRIDKELLAGHKWGEDLFEYKKVGDAEYIFGLKNWDDPEPLYNSKGKLYRIDYSLIGDFDDYKRIVSEMESVLGKCTDEKHDFWEEYEWKNSKLLYRICFYEDLEDVPIISAQIIYNPLWDYEHNW